MNTTSVDNNVSTTTSSNQHSVTEFNTSSNHSNVNTTSVDSNVDTSSSTVSVSWRDVGSSSWIKVMCSEVKTLTAEQKVARATIKQATQGTVAVSTPTPHSNVNTTVVKKWDEDFQISHFSNNNWKNG